MLELRIHAQKDRKKVVILYVVVTMRVVDDPGAKQRDAPRDQDAAIVFTASDQFLRPGSKCPRRVQQALVDIQPEFRLAAKSRMALPGSARNVKQQAP